MKALFIIYLISQSLDITTSLIKYHQGCVESIWPNKVSMISAKSATIAFTFTIRDKKLALIPEIPGIVSGTCATVHNLNQICR